jgi:hypothetical protein
MNRKEIHATEAAVLLAPSLQWYWTAGTPKFGFGLSTIIFITRTCQEAGEVAEEGEMEDQLFSSVLQLRIDACPVSQEQGF